MKDEANKSVNTKDKEKSVNIDNSDELQSVNSNKINKSLYEMLIDDITDILDYKLRVLYEKLEYMQNELEWKISQLYNYNI